MAAACQPPRLEAGWVGLASERLAPFDRPPNPLISCLFTLRCGTVTASLHAASHLSEERFRERLVAPARKLERFSPAIGGTPSRYEVSVHAFAVSVMDAEQLWWREIEPVLESERLGSDTSIYGSLPRATCASPVAVSN